MRTLMGAVGVQVVFLYDGFVILSVLHATVLPEVPFACELGITQLANHWINRRVFGCFAI